MSDENINPTPANSPQKKEKKGTSPKTPRITNSQKEKDPRKVAAGKKLGAISRIAKSQKKYKAEAHNAYEEEKKHPRNSDILYRVNCMCDCWCLRRRVFKDQNITRKKCGSTRKTPTKK